MLEHKEHMSGVKYDMEKFDGRINFDLWQVKVNIVTIQLGLHNNLEKKNLTVFSTGMNNIDNSKKIIQKVEHVQLAWN